MRAHLEKLIEAWMDSFGQKDILNAILALPPTEAVAVILTILDRETDPRAKMRTISKLQDWMRESHPVIYVDGGQARQGEAHTVPAIPAEQQHATALERLVHVSDTIQLQALTQEAADKLERWGRWWIVMQGHDYDRRQPPPPNNKRPPSWFLRSVPRKQQGLSPIKGSGSKLLNLISEQMWLMKEGDPYYRIANVCSCPREFKWKEWNFK